MTAVKIKPLYARFMAEEKELVNGQVVKDLAVNTEYNGKQLHVDKRENNKITHFDIKNDKTLKKLLATPMSNGNLIERLSLEYGKHKRKRTSKRKRMRTSKRKHKQPSNDKTRKKNRGSK